MATINLTTSDDSVVYESSFGNTINGLAGSDVLTLDINSTNNTLNGGEGNDTLASLTTSGNNRLVGGDGDDRYIVTSANDVVVELEEQGFDVIETTLTTYRLPDNVDRLESTRDDTASLNFTGNAGFNFLFDGLGNDRLDGAGGDDEIVSLHGDDIMIGGLGNDGYTFYMDPSGATRNITIIETGDDPFDAVQTDYAEFTLPDRVDNIIGNYSGFGTLVAQRLTGNAGDNRMLDGLLNDTLIGLGGNDTLISAAGNDTLVGGVGDDIYQIMKPIDGRIVTIIEVTGEGSDSVETDLDEYTLAAGVENLRSMLFEPGSNGQILRGNNANNEIQGGAGFDTLMGNGGNDTYVLESAIVDKVVELASQGTDTVRTSYSYTLGLNIENLVGTADGLTLTGNATANRIESINFSSGSKLLGLAGNDTLIAEGASLTLSGGDGNDILTISAFQVDDNRNTASGGSGNDTIYVKDSVGVDVFGGIGDDKIVIDGFSSTINLSGGIGNDTYSIRNPDAEVKIVELADQGTDTIATTATEFSISSLANIENLNGISSTGQTLRGNNEINAIRGNAGDDVLVGSGGKDRLTGGLGSDQFTINRLVDRGDTITDFGSTDFIALGSKAFGSLATGVLSTKNFVSGNVARDANDYFIYRNFDGTLWFDADGNGSGAQRLVVDLENDFTLRASDIMII